MNRIAAATAAAVFAPLALFVASAAANPLHTPDAVQSAPERGVKWGVADRGVKWGAPQQGVKWGVADRGVKWG